MAEPINDGVQNEIDDDGKPTIRVWHKPGKVFFTLVNSPLMENQEGRLEPGMGLCAHAAIEVAHALLGEALKSIEEDTGEEGNDGESDH